MVEKEKDAQFTKLWTEAMPAVSSYIFSSTANYSDCKDILQNTAFTALNKFDQYDHSRSFLNWVLGIARYEILANKRTHARCPIVFHESLMDSISEVVEEMENELGNRTIALRHCMNEQSERNLELLKLRYDKSLRIGQIAEMVNMTEGATKTMLSRIRDALRKCIAGKLDSITYSREK